MAFGGERNPYADERSVAYAYDDRVQNHKQVQIGDLCLRNRSYLEGVGRIKNIVEGVGEKVLHRCAICGSGQIHERKGMLPPYKCNKGHEFVQPKDIKLSVRTFKASFAGSWLSARERISIEELRPFELRDSKQLAIMPGGPGWPLPICRAKVFPHSQPATGVARYARGLVGNSDADDSHDYTPLGADERGADHTRGNSDSS